METAVDSAVGFLLEKLLQLVKDNYDLISGAESKVAKLSKSLRLLKTFATEYTEKHPNSKILKELAEEIKDLIREAEDAIEEYIYYVSVHNRKGFLKKSVHAVDHAIKVRDVSKKIGDVSGKVMEMYEMNSRIGKDALRLEDSAKGSAIGNNRKVILITSTAHA